MDVQVHRQEMVDDDELTRLHALAFGAGPGPVVAWRKRLQRHSLTWVTARRGVELVGFVNVIGDGGAHAVLLDAVVAPAEQGRGIGRALVGEAAAAARETGCAWVHVDYTEEMAGFYEGACGFSPTRAGLLRLW